MITPAEFIACLRVAALDAFMIKAVRKELPADVLHRRNTRRYTAGFNLRARDKVSVFLRFSGCAFLTYYSRDSAISAQNALHEKRTLPGVSVYNVYCKQFTYFSTNYAPVMPPHSVSRPLHRGNLISVSLNKRTLVSPPYCERAPARRGRRRNTRGSEETIYFS